MLKPMLKFTVVNEQVCIDPNIILIEEFSNILQYGKRNDKEDLANKMLIYVFYCCDLTDSNPMRDVDHRMKEEQAMSRVFGNKKSKFTKKEESLIGAAMDAYNFFNETSSERAILAIDAKIDEMRTKLENTEVEIVRNVEETSSGSEKVSFVSNEKIIGNIVENISKMMATKLNIANSAKKIEQSGRVRGNKGSSLIERSRLLVRKENDE